jgi:two-component system phosphate regulon sensor histidine kinase PhoR
VAAAPQDAPVAARPVPPGRGGGFAAPTSRMAPLRIVAVYAVVGALWILFSDRILEALVPAGPLRDTLQTAKGWTYVLATALLLFVLIRRQQAAVRAVMAQVQATFDSMGDAVLVVDPGAVIVEVNRAALRMLGIAGKEQMLGPLVGLVGRFAMRSPDGSPFPADGFASLRALAGETVHRLPAIFRRADGSDVHVEITAAPVLDPGGRGVRFAVAILRDVTEVRQVDEMRDEFLATAAHEFKTPLAIIKAYGQLLQRRSPADATALEAVDRQVDRLSRLVQQLLEVARIRRGSPDLRLGAYDLTGQVKEVVERMRRQAGGARLLLGDLVPLPVRADRSRIEQVLVSLLDNALKFSPRGGDVRIAVTRRDGEAVVSIRDAGVGIPPERQARLFERYYRAHEGDPEDRGGFGLGLDLARAIVERHGGRVWFESQEGAGSTFFFSLPVAEEVPDVTA